MIFMQSQVMQVSTYTDTVTLHLPTIRGADKPVVHDSSTCAINLWGLPRAFRSMVLPSLMKHVISVNAQHNCDYYIHYFNLTYESTSRAGAGGEIKADEIYLIADAIRNVAQAHNLPMPHVHFQGTTNEEFETQYKDLIHKVRYEKDGFDQLRYFPWAQKSLDYPGSIDNIIKMWHTIQSAWDLMKQGEAEHNKLYTRVAMIRSDTVYMTPIDVWRVNSTLIDTNNEYTVLPWFGNPVNDRLVYGPARAVEIWSTQRFARMDEHVERMEKMERGQGIHSERFVLHTLMPLMEQVSTLDRNNDICFLRARVGDSVWVSDCENKVGETSPQDVDKKREIESMIGRECGDITKHLGFVRILNCSAH
jgi:hypothetical protein